MRLVRLCRLFTLLYARDFVFFLAERKDKQKIKTLFRIAQSGKSPQSLTSLTQYQKGQGAMRQIDVLARAVAEVFAPRIDESKFRRDILGRTDAPPGARAWLLRQLPDEEAQEQLRQLREPGMQSAIFHGVIGSAVKINQAKARGRNV